MRQGGQQIAEIFRGAGAGNPDKCLTLTLEAERMYANGGYSAKDRNSKDIVSWCGIFALYCYRSVGLKLSGWPLKWHVGKPPAGDELRLRTPGEKVQPGDIGIFQPSKENHHFVITEVNGTTLSSIDGNSGMLMEITRKQGGYTVSQVYNSGGGFLTPIWDRVL